VPHHLYGVMDGALAASAALWRAMALPLIEQVWQRGRLPVIVGGTGLYLRALIDGIAPVPPVPSEIRDDVRSLTTEARAQALAHEDPVMAARLHAHDSQRLARALEVVRATGRSLAAYHGPQPDGLGAQAILDTWLILPERSQLYAACDARFSAMIEGGALDEVQALLARNLDPALPVMKAVGVPELAACLRGEQDLAGAVATAQQMTRNFAKRQYTWFRNQFSDWPVCASPDELKYNYKIMA
jgi:tRNA dimethylallyltransferase